MKYDGIENLIAQIERAIIIASKKLEHLKLRVSSVELAVKVVFEKKIDGSIDLKVLKIGTSTSSSDTTTITVMFKPATMITAASIESDFLGALEVVQHAISELDNRFEFTSAKIAMGFEVSADGNISIIVGGEASHAVTHTATLTLEEVG